MEAELDQLRQQNRRLKAALEDMKAKAEQERAEAPRMLASMLPTPPAPAPAAPATPGSIVVNNEEGEVHFHFHGGSAPAIAAPAKAAAPSAPAPTRARSRAAVERDDEDEHDDEPKAAPKPALPVRSLRTTNGRGGESGKTSAEPTGPSPRRINDGDGEGASDGASVGLGDETVAPSMTDLLPLLLLGAF
jgi:hypothetical protein